MLARLAPERMPVVVFVTAYDQYAVRAFEVHALDYLLKPVADARFAEALARAKQRVRERRGEVARAGGGADSQLERLAALLAERRSRYLTRLLVPARERTLVVEVDEIDWIEADDYYVALHVGGRRHLLRETLAQLEERLDPERFCRVHRSAIVNVTRVREIHPLFRGDSALILENGERVPLSRTRRADFQRRFAPLAALTALLIRPTAPASGSLQPAWPSGGRSAMLARNRRLRPRQGRAARRPPGHHLLRLDRQPAQALPQGRGHRRPPLCRQRPRADHRRHLGRHRRLAARRRPAPRPAHRRAGGDLHGVPLDPGVLPRPGRDGGWRLYRAAIEFAVAGQREQALATLERASAAGYPTGDRIDTEPAFAALRDDPRARQLVAGKR